MSLIFLGVVAGVVLPLQTLVNTRLRASTGTPSSASLISFAVGTACLAVIALASAGGLPDISAAFSAPAWIWAGGVFGVVALTGNILLFPRLGAVETVVLPIAGQIITGLIIDHFGLFSSPHNELTVLRLVGGLIVLGGVIMAVRQHAPAAPDARRTLFWWRCAGLVFGALTASQSAINGKLGSLVGVSVAALISFTVGTAALIVLNIALRWRPRLETIDGNNPWWMWLGGAFGATFIFSNAFLVPHIGTGLTVVTTLVGMMAGSIAIDRIKGLNPRPLQLFGLVVLLAGVALIRLS